MKKFFLAIVIIFSTVFASCVTMADYNFYNINKNISNRDFQSVYKELDESKTLYTQTDKVLENLDKGLISHYMGDFNKSNEHLTTAENLIFDLYTKSISKEISSVLLNDTVLDYDGDPYEDIYSNIFMALNYLQLDNTEDAFVEIRRFDNKLKKIASKYQIEIEKQKKELNSNSNVLKDVNIEFYNSAFARYLSMLLYRTENDYSSALVDYNKIIEAFKMQKKLYNFSVPKDLKEELVIPEDKARVNFVSFTGLSPIKEEEFFPVFLVEGSYRIALPVMTPRESSIKYVDIEIENLITNESFYKTIEKIESIQNIAMDTYSGKYASIMGKTVARAVAKSVTYKTMSYFAESDNYNTSLLFSALQLATLVSNTVSERADVRTSRFFPNSVYVGGINLDPGIYRIKVIYKSSSNKIIDCEYYDNYQVKKDKLNLIESFCLR